MARGRIVGGVLAVALLGGVLAVVVGGGDDGPARPAPDESVPDEPVPDEPVSDRADSVEVETDPDFAIEQYTGDFRITYRLDDPSGQLEPETDRIAVQAPFESRLETAPGAPPGGNTASIQVATLDRLRIGGVGEAVTVARVPGLAPSTIRLGPVVDEALDAGLLEAREQREIVGRRCQVYRSGSTLGAGPLVPIIESEFADSCIDAQGMLLEETLFVDGTASFRRTAVEVELVDGFDDAAELFDAGDITAPVDSGGGATTPADPTKGSVGQFFELPADGVPDSFELLGRWSVIPPQPEKFADPLQRPTIIAGVADVYADGDGDVVVVYQGATLGQVQAFAPLDFAATVELANLGTGEVLLSAVGTELRFAQPAGRFVHVFGSVEPDVLEAVAGALVETEGEGLVLLDE